MAGELLALPFGVAIGVLLGLVGGGGSILAVPVLVYVLGNPSTPPRPSRCSSSGAPRSSARPTTRESGTSASRRRLPSASPAAQARSAEAR
jgi:hypothetical protein